MKIESASDVFELLGAYTPSAALSLALELGLFWNLAESPLPVNRISKHLSIPENRCRYWLDILVELGLLEIMNNHYSPSETAKIAILSTISQDAWHNIASESSDSYPYLANLTDYIHEPGSALKAQGMERKNYFLQLKDDPERAKRFTHMLYQFHRSLSRNLAEALDLGNIKRLMDLGGGSGIMSHALLSQYPDVSSTIVDINNVCAAGKEIVSDFSTVDRIKHFPADFVTDELPGEFDLILECDVGVYGEALFRKLKGCLNPGGRLIIVDLFAPEFGKIPPGRPLSWGFIGSLADPNFSFPTTADIKAQLVKSGFQIISEIQLPDHWLMIDAVSPAS